ncbi:hypothetical protein SAY86_002443 [Trapa natans]|uniref:Uncharacterized protein n=1 Tax=Trapa natans TaxID=22666 RepID=A0AAN7LJ47_TRANT|nr:hypothetical protein SAY86_002443 [Trapa natans]
MKRPDQSERLRAEHSVRETHSSPSPTHQKVQSEIRFRRKKTQLLSTFSQHGTVSQTMKMMISLQEMMISLQDSRCKHSALLSESHSSVHFPLEVGISLPFPLLRGGT